MSRNGMITKAELAEKFEALANTLDLPARLVMFADLNQVLDRFAGSLCEICKGSGIATVVTSPPHVKPIRMKEIRCPNNCNAQGIEDIIATSRAAMNAETDKYVQAARNPQMLDGWKGA